MPYLVDGRLVILQSRRRAWDANFADSVGGACGNLIENPAGNDQRPLIRCGFFGVCLARS